MLVNLAGSDVLELSLFIRALLYALAFYTAGMWILGSNIEESRRKKFLGWLLVIIAIVNIIMAGEWLYLFFFTEATV